MKIKAILFVAAALAGTAFAGQAQAQTLDSVRNRGELRCGTHPGLPGFAAPDEAGRWAGHEIDYCRALAAAIFKDVDKAKYVPLSAKSRFAALQSGEVDVLFRVSSWTSSRDLTMGLSFGSIYYYEGQGFLVAKKLNITSAKDLGGASVCVEQASTTELNLTDFARTNNIKLEPVVFSEFHEAIKALESGRCDAYTTDQLGLYSARLRFAEPDDYVVLPDIISKEPVASVVRKDDAQWFDVVRWLHYALLNAEELGVTQANVEESLKSDNPAIRRLLGVEGSFGTDLGLPNDFMVTVIKNVGNYGEIFERNVGSGSPLKIARGLNEPWSKGGLQYAPPIR